MYGNYSNMCHFFQMLGKDLLIVISDSGKLSFLTFCNEMHRLPLILLLLLFLCILFFNSVIKVYSWIYCNFSEFVSRNQVRS